MSRLRVMRLGFLLLLLICFLVWASRSIYLSNSTMSLEKTFKPDHSFSGRIVVTVIDAKSGDGKDQILIDLDHGEVSDSPNLQFDSTLKTGHIDDCWGIAEVKSPSLDFVVTCSNGGGAKWSARNLLSVLKSRSNEQVQQWTIEQNWKVCGLVWSTDSRSVGVLLEKERTDFGLMGLVSAASGHPIPLETFKVVIYAVESDRNLKLPIIRKDLPSGWASINWIQ
jgi:hypothetical protein